MNQKEVSEIKRRFRVDKTNISHIRGAFVNDEKQIVSTFDQSLGLLKENEIATILSLVKKVLSGSIGKNLIDLAFSTKQVEEGEEHKLLMRLRDSSLTDEEAVSLFYAKVIEGVELEGNFLILLLCDTYDVFAKKRVMGEESESTEQYRYIVSAICPVKDDSISLTYNLHDTRLCEASKDCVVHAPELGFLFPAFDYRATNLYGALYYTRDTGDSHQSFVDTLFHTPLPMPAKAQKGNFNALLSDTIGEELSLIRVDAVQTEIKNRIEIHKESKDPEPLTLSVNAISDILTNCGVTPEKVEAFAKEYNDTFGKATELPPQNIVPGKSFEVETPKVHIKVAAEDKDLIDLRVIDGVRYIMIRADENVDINGVSVVVREDNSASSDQTTDED